MKAWNGRFWNAQKWISLYKQSHGTFERSKVPKNRRAVDLLRRALCGTLRCKNEGPSRILKVIKNTTGAFLHPSHAYPKEQTPPAQIKGRVIHQP